LAVGACILDLDPFAYSYDTRKVDTESVRMSWALTRVLHYGGVLISVLAAKDKLVA
jgi:hypothetical protein